MKQQENKVSTKNLVAAFKDTSCGYELIIRAKCHPRSHFKSGLAEKCQGIPSQGKTSQCRI